MILGVVLAVFVYALSEGAGAACTAAVTFIENNAVIIGIICGIILLILVVCFFFMQSGSIGKRIFTTIGEALALSQFLFGIVYVFYDTVQNGVNGGIFSLIFFSVSLILYLVVGAINFVLTGFTTMALLYDKSQWYNRYILAAYFLGFAGWIYMLS